MLEASPFLNKGIVLEIFSALGKMPLYNIWFIINAKGLIMVCFIYFSILFEMSYLPELLLFSNVFSIVNMSSSGTSSNYKIDLLVFSSIVQTYHYWSDQVCLTGHCQYSQNIH